MAQYRIPSDYQNDVPKSVHRWNSPVAGTIHPGLAYPVKWYHLDAGDRLRGKPAFLVQSQPMLGPLLQGFKLVTIGTFTPDSVLYGWLSSGISYTPQEIMGFDHYTFNPGYIRYPAGDMPYADSRLVANYHAGLGSQDVGLYSMGLGLGPGGMSGLTNDSSTLPDGTESVDYRFHVGRGSLWEWLGVPAGATYPLISPLASGTPTSYLPSKSFSWRVEPLVSYALSCYYYLANMQERYMQVSVGGYRADAVSLAFDDVFTAIDPKEMLLELDSYRHASMTPSYTTHDFAKYSLVPQNVKSPFMLLCYRGLYAHGGFFSVPFSPDLFNNLIMLGQSPSAYIPVLDASDGDKVAVPQMRIQTKIQSWMDRLFVSGGRLGDVFRTLWGKKSNPYSDKPEFLGVWQSSINPSNVVATASGSADGESANLGQMAARIDKYSDFSGHSGVDFTAKEPGTVMFISFLIPDVAYAQGLDPRLYGMSFADDFNPELNGLGFMSVPRNRYTLMPIETAVVYNSVDPTTFAIGDSVAWDYYKTDFPRLHGELTPNGVFNYWALCRRYTEYYSVGGGSVTGVRNDFGSYINPLAWQYVFTSGSIFDPNFILFANLDFSVVSSVKSTYMPYMSK